MRKNNYIGYIIFMAGMIFCSWTCLAVALLLAQKGSLPHFYIMCVMSILIAMFIPGIWVSVTIEKRFDRLEDLIKKRKEINDETIE